MRFLLTALTASALLLPASARAADECSSDAECPGSNWFCLNGQCVEQHTGAQCYNDVDCAIGDHCVSGVCER